VLIFFVDILALRVASIWAIKSAKGVFSAIYIIKNWMWNRMKQIKNEKIIQSF